MTLTAQIQQAGGPEVIEWVERELPPPGPGEVRMRNGAIGLNFIDTYHRSGLYPLPMPAGLGIEAAGEVVAIGADVTAFKPGDRVCTMGPMTGAYAEEWNLPAAALFLTPESLSDEMAAASLLKACTVEALVERCARVEAGWPVLVHAAAGGVGQILVQWLKQVGAVVIATASTPEKLALAQGLGADQCLLSGDPDLAKQVRALTNGAGVRVSFDGVGRDSWSASLDATARRGLIVSYGNASGPVTGVDLGTLAAKGALFVTRMGVFPYYVGAEERAQGSARALEMVTSGKINIAISQRYALRDAAQAHRDLEARKTTGSSVLLPG